MWRRKYSLAKLEYHDSLKTHVFGFNWIVTVCSVCDGVIQEDPSFNDFIPGLAVNTDSLLGLGDNIKNCGDIRVLEKFSIC